MPRSFGLTPWVAVAGFVSPMPNIFDGHDGRQCATTVRAGCPFALCERRSLYAVDACVEHALRRHDPVVLEIVCEGLCYGLAFEISVNFNGDEGVARKGWAQ